MSDLTLESIDSLGDYLLNNVYEIQAISLPIGITGLAAEDINLRANSMSIPDLSVNYIPITHRTFTKEQPTHRTNITEVTFTMLETSKPKTLPFLRDWANLCAMKETNFISTPEQRKMDFLVYLKTNDEIAWVWQLQKCQIVTKGNIDLSDGSSANAIIPNIQMKCQMILEGPTVSELK